MVPNIIIIIFRSRFQLTLIEDMKLWFILLHVALVGLLDAKALLNALKPISASDRSVPLGTGPHHARWFDSPKLHNIQLSIQDMSWAASDFNEMEAKIQELVAEKPNIFQAVKDLREATDSKGYQYKYSQG